MTHSSENILPKRDLNTSTSEIDLDTFELRLTLHVKLETLLRNSDACKIKLNIYQFKPNVLQVIHETLQHGKNNFLFKKSLYNFLRKLYLLSPSR